MRPGLVFVGLFAVLIAVYALLQDSLGSTVTFLLQAAIVLVILAATIWFRQIRTRRGWFMFGEDDDESPGAGGEAASGEVGEAESERELPKAS